MRYMVVSLILNNRFSKSLITKYIDLLTAALQNQSKILSVLNSLFMPHPILSGLRKLRTKFSELEYTDPFIA